MVNYWVGSHNPARTSGSMFELWISDGFEWFVAVNFMYPNGVLARSNRLILIPVTVKSWLDFLVCALQSDLLWHFSMSAPCFHVTKATKQWRIVEIEFLATVGRKRGCQPFSCPSSKNVRHCRKEICSTCLLQESMPFVKSKPPLPTRSLRFLQSCSRLHQLHITVASCWQKIELWYSRFGLQDIDCDLVGLEVGLPAFQLPIFEKCEALLKGDLWDMFFAGIHAFCEIFASTPYKKLEVPESCSRLHQLHIMVASCWQKIELWYPRFGLQDIDCDLVGLEVGLPAFQLPIFEKCEALLKGDLWDMFFAKIHAFCEI